VVVEEVDHAVRGVEALLTRRVDLGTEEAQACIVSEVDVGQEDAVEEGRTSADALRQGQGSDSAGTLDLLWQVRRGVDQEGTGRLGVDDHETGHESDAGRVAARGLAAGIVAADLRQPTVLSRAEQHGEGARVDLSLARGGAGGAGGGEEDCGGDPKAT
jgi:hypothetical protein